MTTRNIERPAAKRQADQGALRLIGYGLYVLTTRCGDERHAITFNWLTQISFEPQLVLAALENQSHSRQLVQAGGVFAINFLRQDQLDLARRMAIPHRMNRHKLAGVPHHDGVTGAPLLDVSLGYLECEVRQVLEVEGDHVLFIGEVVAGGVKGADEPLTLLQSRLRYK